MQIETRITLDMLTAESVSVLTQRFVDGEQLGQNHRRAFVNSEEGIAEIIESLEEPYLSTVLTMWGVETDSEDLEVMS